MKNTLKNFTNWWFPKFETDKWPFSDIFLPTTMLSFTKLKFRRSYWGAEQVYILIGSKVIYDKKHKYFPFVFFQFCKKKLVVCVMFYPFFVFLAFFCIYVITFEPIKIQTHSAPQNNRLNFSFLKDIHVVGKKKWPEVVV
jgi:hypothetical protein